MTIQQQAKQWAKFSKLVYCFKHVFIWKETGTPVDPFYFSSLGLEPTQNQINAFILWNDTKYIDERNMI